jgi:hypothetical protein
VLSCITTGIEFVSGMETQRSEHHMGLYEKQEQTPWINRIEYQCRTILLGFHVKPE